MRDYDECQPYVDHLLMEHKRVHAMLNGARNVIRSTSGPDQDATLDDVVRTLRLVRQELVHHFAEEEGGGCLEEAVSRCPRLSAEVGRLEAEHPELLNEVDLLIAEALDARATVAGRIAVQRRFDHLVRQLHAHEAAENAILRQGFGMDVNGDESGKTSLTLDT